MSPKEQAAVVNAVDAETEALPGHVKHVHLGTYDVPEGEPGGPRRSSETWCGRRTVDWAFVDASHAALNARAEGYTLICPQCAKAIVEAIMSGAWQPTNRAPT